MQCRSPSSVLSGRSPSDPRELKVHRIADSAAEAARAG
jgi:hypothetical protein